jgi:SAM-dependent methyltransferase
MKKLLQLIALFRSQKLLLDSFCKLTLVPRCGDLNAALENYKESLGKPTSLDIGCGINPRNPFYAKNVCGVDLFSDDPRNIKKADLFTEKIPYIDNSFDYVTAFDFIEHVPRVIYSPNLRFPFVELMNEIYRVLKPEGLFLAHTPIFPFPASFQDPTHVNIITEDTFPKYFDDSKRFASIYGFQGAFKIEIQQLSPPYLISILRKK